ncbi:hypothetical protein GCM10009617_36090 [Leifsonia poae]|uniref:Uncharacterized protein n=1 Tax=Leifsonia poae TaxID=110933 RepID=A0A9W6M0B9_9MICO|nr:hypothetical protein GCM10017584_20880 [Leifsonia poae]
MRSRCNVGRLLDGGMIEAGDERRAQGRGAVERSYRLPPDRPTVTPEASAAMTTAEHRNGFAAAMADLIA